MTELRVIHGPPGTGKTTTLTRLFELAVQRYGPNQVAAVTYTRAAAQELRTRAAQLLGLRGDERDLTRQLPYVGTIHALCYHGLKNPKIVSRKLMKEFLSNESMGTAAADAMPEVDELEGFWYASMQEQDEDQSAMLAMRQIAIARHRLDPSLMTTVVPGTSIQVDLTDFYRKYVSWKQARQVWDFEDLLEQGLHLNLPVKILIVDEAQDNSPLMWRTVLNWAKGADKCFIAGDPFQAIYAWAGAEPSLLMRLGEKAKYFNTLNHSWRLTPASAIYADSILREGGWSDDRWMGTWHGSEKTSSETDGSVFWLARTRRLLYSARDILLDEGTPFTELRGVSPWSGKPANAYRLLSGLIEGDIAPLSNLRLIAEVIPSEMLPTGLHAELMGLKGAKGDVTQKTAERVLRAPLGTIQNLLPYAHYLHTMVERHGRNSLYLKPKTQIGTIHAAKGKEADDVHLITSWGYLPARALADVQGQKEEACVAYVGATRHRHRLILESPPRAMGRGYPWPIG